MYNDHFDSLLSSKENKTSKNGPIRDLNAGPVTVWNITRSDLLVVRNNSSQESGTRRHTIIPLDQSGAQP